MNIRIITIIVHIKYSQFRFAACTQHFLYTSLLNSINLIIWRLLNESLLSYVCSEPFEANQNGPFAGEIISSVEYTMLMDVDIVHATLFPYHLQSVVHSGSSISHAHNL